MMGKTVAAGDGEAAATRRRSWRTKEAAASDGQGAGRSWWLVGVDDPWNGIRMRTERPIHDTSATLKSILNLEFY